MAAQPRRKTAPAAPAKRQPSPPAHPVDLPTLLYTKEETANILRCSVPTIERLIRRGVLASLKAGRYRCVPRVAIDAYIAAQIA